MLQNYKFHADTDNSSEDSGYESEGGTEYRPLKNIGSGSYAKARKFQSTDGQKSKAVLKPIDQDDVDFEEAYTKYNFFKTIYPKQSIELIELADTYRLVLPFIVGIPYKQLHITNKKQQIELFISAIKALKDSHNKGFIILDLKSDNIHYDRKSGKSYLLDGGLSVKENELINPDIFIVNNNKELMSNKKKYTQIAPECWSQKSVTAQKSMDVYALGAMMHSLLNPSPDISRLIQTCLSPKPEHRPTLHALEKQLRNLLPPPRNQQRNAPNEKHSSNEKNYYVDSLKILTAQGIVLTKRQYIRLRKNTEIPKAIIDFNNDCIQFQANSNRIKHIYFSIYKRETLALLLRGAIEFKKEYPIIVKSAIVSIDNRLFTKFTRTQSIKILTTLNSSKIELATTATFNKSKGNFLFFQDPIKIPGNNEVKNWALSKIEKPNYTFS